MTSRKNFIRTTAIASAGILLNACTEKSGTSSKPKNTKKPIVISTWDFGLTANEASWNILNENGRAIDAVEAGIKIPEADPNNQTVGYGGRPDRDGHVTLDACIMDEFSNIGSVACLEHIMHPISVARAVMEKTPHVMLVGEGALSFALECGFPKENLLTEASEKGWKEWLKTAEYKPIINIENHDTIGLLALDKHGNLSGGCSTSGMAYKMRGRVGDSPIIGAGLYVDNEIGAATSSGSGEEVIRMAGSHLVVELMRHGRSPQEACEEAVNRISKSLQLRKKDLKDFQIAFIALNKQGETGAYALQKGFVYATYCDNANKLTDSAYLMKS